MDLIYHITCDTLQQVWDSNSNLILPVFLLVKEINIFLSLKRPWWDSNLGFLAKERPLPLCYLTTPHLNHNHLIHVFYIFVWSVLNNFLFTFQHCWINCITFKEHHAQSGVSWVENFFSIGNNQSNYSLRDKSYKSLEVLLTSTKVFSSLDDIIPCCFLSFSYSQACSGHLMFSLWHHKL